MNKVMTAICAFALGAAFVGQPARARADTDVATRPEPPGVLDRAGFKPMYNVLPANIDKTTLQFDNRGTMATPDATFVTIPLWQFSLTDAFNNTAYKPIFVGAVPAKAGLSNIPIYLLEYKFTFADKFVSDATKPVCGDTVAVPTRFLESPIFYKTALKSNGIALGARQYIDGFDTAEFRGLGIPAGYELNYINEAKYARVVSVTVPAADGTTGYFKSDKGCGAKTMGFIKQSWFDALNRSVIAKLNFPHTMVAFSLFNNTYMYGATTADCCILGYHSGYGTSTYNQFYGVGAYEAAGVFAGAQDITALSHELGELTNDPIGNNPVPAWGHIGQQSGCQDNFEVGDPIQKDFPVVANRYVYHPQDLAFFSWFYRGTAANKQYLGTGKYSFNGTLTSLQAVCR